MKKKILSLALTASLAVSMPLAVHGETSYGSSDWKVSFIEGDKMESNFKSSDIADAVSKLQIWTK